MRQQSLACLHDCASGSVMDLDDLLFRYIGSRDLGEVTSAAEETGQA